MSAEAVFYALRAGPFVERYLAPPKGSKELFDACKQDCLLEEWDAGWDCGSLFNDAEDGALGVSVTDLLEAQEPQRDAWRDLLATLAGSGAAGWITALGSGDDGDSGVVPPDALARVAARLRETGMLEAARAALEEAGEADAASSVNDLVQFVVRAADAGAWVVWRSR